MKAQLLAGFSEVDITPPVGTLVAGSIEPRPSHGILDPLYIKAVVLESQGVRLAYVIMDTCYLLRSIGDQCVALACKRTGIPANHVVWACTHSHSSPITSDIFPYEGSVDPVNHTWMDTFPQKFAECVARADVAKVPARMSRARSYQSAVCHNRRMRYKDGREINTWLLHGGEDDLQCVGAAGPIDPEINVMAFDGEDGRMLGVLFNFALHANSRGGNRFSGDYPAVVAARLRERFGPQVVTLYMPGACGDINPVMSWRQTGDLLAEAIIPVLEGRKPSPGSIGLGATKREIAVPCRDFNVPQQDRIKRSQWWPREQEVFRQNIEILRKTMKAKEITTCVHAWRIGDIGFAGLPGEAFVDWGIQLKQKSPFPWTFPVELCGDCVGYLVTKQAWEAGGYESLLATFLMVSVRGCEMMVDNLLDMLNGLRRQG